MAILWVHEGYQKNFDRKINSYTEELEDIQDRYTSALNLIDNYGGSSINNCDIYLKKRKKALSLKIKEAASIQKSAHTYVSSVLSADQTIAGSIHSQSYNFYQEKGIGPQSDTSVARAWNAICTTTSDFWHDVKGTTREVVADIKEFYEENKYFVNLIFDAIAVLGAVALFTLSGGTLFGVICLIGATWAMSKAVYETVTDVMALDAHLSGDEARAEELAGSTLSGFLIERGEILDQKWGTHFMETSMKVLTIGLEVCEFVASLVVIYESFKKIFHLDKCASLKLNKCGYRTWNENLADLKKIKWGSTAKTPRLKSALNWTKFVMKNLGFSFNQGAKSFQELLDTKSIRDNLGIIKDTIGGKSLLIRNPIVKEGLDFSDEITAILLM